jgi:hypothetical protein
MHMKHDMCKYNRSRNINVPVIVMCACSGFTPDKDDCQETLCQIVKELVLIVVLGE